MKDSRRLLRFANNRYLSTPLIHGHQLAIPLATALQNCGTEDMSLAFEDKFERGAVAWPGLPLMQSRIDTFQPLSDNFQQMLPGCRSCRRSKKVSLCIK